MSAETIIDVLVIVSVAIGGVALVVALLEAMRRGLTSDRATAPRLGALHARRLYDRAVFGFAPTIVATAVTALRSDDASSAALVFVAMGLTTAVARRFDEPLHLMPLARYVSNALVPATGMAIAMVPGTLGGADIDGRTAAVALFGAVLTTVVAGWLQARFEVDHPIRLAVVGSASFTAKLSSELRETGIRGYRVIGYVDGESPNGGGHGVRRLGEMDDIRSIVRGEAIDLLVLGPKSPRLDAFEHVTRACLDLPVRMIEATALYEAVLGHVPIGTINSAWFQFITHPRFSPSSPLSKRALDLCVTLALMPVVLPILLACAVAVKLEDRGPVFYRQRRVGEQGRIFTMIKFRTLIPQADDLFDTFPEEELITRVGAMLRKLHLNEMPQLLQVVRGDMTLVGPRPEPPTLVRELSHVVPHYERRALLKPGVTGWAQVRCGYAGSHHGTAWKMCHDLYYIKHRSIRFDLLIMAQTLGALAERRDEQLPAPDFIVGEVVPEVSVPAEVGQTASVGS